MVVLIIVGILVKTNNNAGHETKAFCIENRYNILNKEMDLHLQLIGQRILLNDNTKSNKIAIIQLDTTNKLYDFKRDLQMAMEYYSDKKDTSSGLKDIDLLFLAGNADSPILGTIRENFKNKITIVKESSKSIADRFSLRRKGVIVLYLNKDNVCLYAYYLEQNNARKIMENSPVIFQLIKNIK